MEIKNWSDKIPRLQGKLYQWKDRELSLFGKVLVIKTEVISTIAQLAKTLPPPHKIIVSLRKMIYRFIWGTQQEKIKREIMYRPPEKGEERYPKWNSN